MTNQTNGQEQNHRRMQGLTKAATVFSKLFEVAYWVGAVVFLARRLGFRHDGAGGADRPRLLSARHRP